MTHFSSICPGICKGVGSEKITVIINKCFLLDSELTCASIIFCFASITACISAWSFFNSSSTAISLECGRKDISTSTKKVLDNVEDKTPKTHQSSIFPLLPNKRPVIVCSFFSLTLERHPLWLDLTYFYPLWDSIPIIISSLSSIRPLCTTNFILKYETT